MPTIAENIRRRRTELKLSQAELAERAGMLQPAIARIERGQQSDHLVSSVRAIARALGCTAAELIE